MPSIRDLNTAELGSYLIDKGSLNEIAFETIVNHAATNNISFTESLTQYGHLNPRDIAEIIANYFSLPFFNLDCFKPNDSALKALNLNLIQKYLALPLDIQCDQLFLAVADPTMIDINEINFLTDLTASFIIVERDKLIKIIDSLSSDQLKTDILLADHQPQTSNHSERSIGVDLSQIKYENAPVVTFLNKIIIEAVKKGASDIHFEPYEDDYRIRFRIDGILYEISRQSHELVNYVTTRLKIMANLDIAEHRLPQDGGFKLSLSENKLINFRLSICPTLHGEKSVVRILNSNNNLLDINSLGMDVLQEKLFLSALDEPQGLILITGPTGSGKTMTLYSALNKLNSGGVNICTVEDPIEMYLHGVNQIQVNLKTELTFATALRAFLRQDPDIIMVGEIRDLETADIAIKAAQTGHLVFATLHTNSAIETIFRLSTLGLHPHYFANSIRLIVAQRLVRRLCDFCKINIALCEEQLLQQGFNLEELNDLTIYESTGCSTCKKGYKGRIGIFEILSVSKNFTELIMENANYFKFIQQMHKEKFFNLRHSALNKVRQGLTSLEEINRSIKINH